MTLKDNRFYPGERKRPVFLFKIGKRKPSHNGLMGPNCYEMSRDLCLNLRSVHEKSCQTARGYQML